MNILLAVDGSPDTKTMLAYLAAHDWLESRNTYTVLTVPTALPTRARRMAGKDAVDIYYQEEADRVLRPAVKFLARHGVEAKPVTKVGQAGETIAAYADAGKFDLIVMGAHGHSALAGLVMGSVTTKVLARSRVPVLVVR